MPLLWVQMQKRWVMPVSTAVHLDLSSGGGGLHLYGVQACFALTEFLLFAHAGFWFRKGNLGVIQGSNGQAVATSVFLLVSPSSVSCLQCRLPLKHGEREACPPLSACCCSYPDAADWGLVAKTRICWYKGVRPCPECDESAHVRGI